MGENTRSLQLKKTRKQLCFYEQSWGDIVLVFEKTRAN